MRISRKIDRWYFEITSAEVILRRSFRLRRNAPQDDGCSLLYHFSLHRISVTNFLFYRVIGEGV